MLTPRNATAYAVLAHMYEQADAEESAEFWIRFYANGREEGFAVELSRSQKEPLMVVFAEDRHAGKIVLYYGPRRCFAPLGMIPDDSLMDKARRFDFKSHQIAAIQAIEFLFQKKEPTGP